MGRAREAVAALRACYPHYAGQALEERPIIRIAVHRIVGWGAGLAPVRGQESRRHRTASGR